MSEPDAELVARVQRGDTAAFEALVRRHFRMAFLVAFAQLVNREEAEDVCQDAFLRCWERIHECREPDRVSAWIGRIVRNMAHNRREFLAVRSAEPLEGERQLTTGRGADWAAEQAEMRQKLRHALGTLGVSQREVVLLHDYEGFRHAEIASRLGISEEMSRRHLSDARKRLRNELRDHEPMKRRNE